MGRLKAVFVLVLVALGLAMVPAPAQAAYPKTSFNVTYGNSYVRGTFTWYNQSIGVSGTLHAASGCREVHYYATVGSANTVLDYWIMSVCNGTDSHGFTMQANVEGGAARTYAFFYDDNSENIDDWRRAAICLRSGCQIYSPPAALLADLVSPSDLAQQLSR
jgi:hypothetical protein